MSSGATEETDEPMPVRDLLPPMERGEYIYDAAAAGPTVEAVLDRLADRDEVERRDLAAADDPRAARRDAVLSIRESIRIGGLPEELYDADGNLDLSPGVLITEAETGRRSVHVGSEALAAVESTGTDE